MRLPSQNSGLPQYMKGKCSRKPAYTRSIVQWDVINTELVNEVLFPHLPNITTKIKTWNWVQTQWGRDDNMGNSLALSVTKWDIQSYIWDVISFNVWRGTQISIRGVAKIWDGHHHILVCDTHLFIHVKLHCLSFLPKAAVASWPIDIVILEDIRVGIVEAEVLVAPRQAWGGGVACQDGALIVCQRQQHKVVLQGWALRCPLLPLSKDILSLHSSTHLSLPFCFYPSASWSVLSIIYCLAVRKSILSILLSYFCISPASCFSLPQFF